MQVSHEPTITFLDIYVREMKTFICTKTCIRIFMAAVIVKNWKQPKFPSVGEWLDNCGIFTPQNTSL